jgi:hypothetical protein
MQQPSPISSTVTYEANEKDTIKYFFRRQTFEVGLHSLQLLVGLKPYWFQVL